MLDDLVVKDSRYIYGKVSYHTKNEISDFYDSLREVAESCRGEGVSREEKYSWFKFPDSSSSADFHRKIIDLDYVKIVLFRRFRD